MARILGTIASATFIPEPLPGSYESIMTTTLSGSQNVIELSSIPSTYDHLQVRIVATSTRSNFSADNIQVRFNDDSSSNYGRHYFQGDGDSEFGGGGTASLLWCGQIPSVRTPNIFGISIIDILDYTNTNKYKTTKALFGADLNGTPDGIAAGPGMWSGLWKSTAAISKITFTAQSTGYAAGTRFSLYGIKAPTQ